MLKSRWLHWLVIPGVVVGGWQAWVNKDTVLKHVPSFSQSCDCDTKTVDVKPAPAPTPPPAPVVVRNDPPPPFVCPNKMPVKASKDEDLLNEVLNFIVEMADKAVSEQNPELAKCVLDDLSKLTTNDKLLKLPKARLQDIHTKASYTMRKLKANSTAHHTAIINPWMATLEDKSVKADDKSKLCK